MKYYFQHSVVENCYVTGTVNATGIYVGGLAGHVNGSGLVMQSYSSANVTSTGGSIPTNKNISSYKITYNEEFVSRINANIKKIRIPTKKIIKIRNLIINIDEHKCFVNGNLVELTNIEFDILDILMQSPDVVVTRKKILKDIWNFDVDSETRTLDMHIKAIRKKIGEFSQEVYIETIRGIGYVINSKTI